MCAWCKTRGEFGTMKRCAVPTDMVLRHEDVDTTPRRPFETSPPPLKRGTLAQCATWHSTACAKNPAKAIGLLTTAAGHGSPAALKFLVNVYDHGDGVPRDSKVAAKWELQLAEKGDLGAQFHTSVRYQEGPAVQPSQASSVQWCRAAAERGHPVAARYLGFRCEHGKGVVSRGGRAGGRGCAGWQGNKIAQNLMAEEGNA